MHFASLYNARLMLKSRHYTSADLLLWQGLWHSLYVILLMVQNHHPEKFKPFRAAKFNNTAMTGIKALAEEIAVKTLLPLSPRERQNCQTANLELLWISWLSLRLEEEVMVPD